MLAGGSPLFDSAKGRLFVAAGTALYEVFINGTYNTLGTIADDATHTPVQMAVNGGQLAVIASGLFYLHDGISLTQPGFTGYQGNVNTSVSGTTYTVDWLSGSQFDDALVGQSIILNATNYTVAQVVSSTQLLLSTSAGNQTNLRYYANLTSGTCDQVGTAVTWRDGPFFDQRLVGTAFFIEGISFNVASVQDSTHLTLSGSTVTQIDATWSSTALNTIQAQTGVFQGGYFIVALPNSKQFNFSALYDGKTWGPLDFAIKESYPDNIGCLIADHDELYVFGEKFTEGWRALTNPPAAGSPYGREMSISMSTGVAAIYSAASSRNGPVWLGADLRGNPVFYAAQGFQPVRLSTYAIEAIWATYSTAQDAETYIVEVEGHELAVIQFPTGDATWVMDMTASAELGKACWSEWNDTTDGTTFHRFRGRQHAYVWGQHWMGDYQTGAIYPLSTTVYQDNYTMIYCVRTFPHLSETALRQFFSRLQLDLETGLASITVKLEWSKDGGHTFIQPKTVSIPQADVHTNPNYLARALFNRLGSGRDRVFRVTVTGNCRIALVGCYIDQMIGIS
jgi:hypothetical protein